MATVEQMRARQQNSRLMGREEQTRSWAAPLPDFTAFPRTVAATDDDGRFYEGVRVRAEWETRDTTNNRHWAATLEAGSKQVTSAMLAAHPSAGAETMTPGSARTDERHYTQGQYFPDERRVLERPMLPPGSLFRNAWMDGFDVDGPDVVREVRGSVKETMRFREADTSARIMGRTFENQWIPAEATAAIVQSQIDAAARLRPVQDDFRTSWRPPA